MLLKKKILLFFFVFLSNVSVYCQNIKQKIPQYLLALKTRADFDLLKGEPLSANFKGIECVKLVYVLASKTLYYLESKKYKWHYRFAQEVLSEQDDLEQFNLKNYNQSSERKYILATFNFNVNTKNYFLQFAACDNPSDEMITILTEKVSTTFFKQKQFKLLLNTTVLLRRKNKLSQKYEVLSSDELFKNQTYQPICKGKVRGILKFILADSLKQNVNYSNNILILKGSSNQIPVCKGLITDEFQTPLSHICLLTNNRKTPAAALKNIFSIDSLKKYENKAVELIVGDEKLQLRTCILNNEKKQGKSKKTIKLFSDTNTAMISDLN